jgi:hypothetical protein
MSPEQVRRVRDLDVRCDIYSMGVILYEGLCGVLPFGEAGSVEALVHLSQGDRPQPLIERRPELGRAISDLVEHAMEPDRTRRFASAKAMLHALHHVLQSGHDGLLLKTTAPETRRCSSVVNGYAEAIGSSPSYIHAPSGVGDIGLDQPDIVVLGSPADSGGTNRTARIHRLALAAISAIVVLAGASLYALVDGDEIGTMREEPVATERAVPPPESTQRLTVKVALVGAPEDAAIRVDGHLARGPSIVLPRDHREHLIEVSAPGFERWTTVHRAVEDAEVAIRMHPEPPIVETASTLGAKAVVKRRTKRRTRASDRPEKAASLQPARDVAESEHGEPPPNKGPSKIIRSPDY